MGITPDVEVGFAIYLLSGDGSPRELAILSRLELEETPLLSADDIVSYREATHEIELTSAGYSRIADLSVPVGGKAFAVCVDGQPVYAGAFWTRASSLSFDGVVIDPHYATAEHPALQVRLGYPGPAFFRGEDPRSDPRILQALEEAGKMK